MMASVSSAGAERREEALGYGVEALQRRRILRAGEAVPPANSKTSKHGPRARTRRAARDRPLPPPRPRSSARARSLAESGASLAKSSASIRRLGQHATPPRAGLTLRGTPRAARRGALPHAQRAALAGPGRRAARHRVHPRAPRGHQRANSTAPLRGERRACSSIFSSTYRRTGHAVPASGSSSRSARGASTAARDLLPLRLQRCIPSGGGGARLHVSRARERDCARAPPASTGPRLRGSARTPAAAAPVRARVLRLLLFPAREEHLRLDPRPGRRHLQELAGALQFQPVQRPIAARNWLVMRAIGMSKMSRSCLRIRCSSRSSGPWARSRLTRVKVGSTASARSGSPVTPSPGA